MSGNEFGQGSGMDEWARNIGDILEEMRTRSFFDFRDGGTWRPATNVYETRDAYFICIELAGVTADVVKVECIDQQRVVIVGRRHQPRPEGIEGPLSVQIMEIEEGPFCREIDLPEPVDDESSDISYKQGNLWITLPKRARP